MKPTAIDNRGGFAESDKPKQPKDTKSLPKMPSKPPYKPLNLQSHEIIALEIVLEDYLKDRQPTSLSKVGDIHISRVLNKVRRLK